MNIFQFVFRYLNLYVYLKNKNKILLKYFLKG